MPPRSFDVRSFVKDPASCRITLWRVAGGVLLQMAFVASALPARTDQDLAERIRTTTGWRSRR